METKKSGTPVFTLTRTFNAPLELVYKAFTEADRLARWWGPKGYKFNTSKLDFRPEGMFLYGMTSPGGDEMWGRFIYKEIIAQKKISFIVSFSDKDGGIRRHPMAPDWPLEVLSTVEFTEENGKTTLILSSTPVNASETEINTFEGGFASMNQGFKGTLDQLEEYLSLNK